MYSYEIFVFWRGERRFASGADSNSITEFYSDKIPESKAALPSVAKEIHFLAVRNPYVHILFHIVFKTAPSRVAYGFSPGRADV